MSVLLRTLILCDTVGCKQSFDDGARRNRNEQREDARASGWIHVKEIGQDFCPSCAKEVQKHIRVGRSDAARGDRREQTHSIVITGSLDKEDFHSDILTAEAERLAWSLETFPEATALSSLLKAEAEIEEIRADLLNEVREPKEYVDAIMCLFDSAARSGISAREIAAAYAEKVAINKKRRWIKNPDNTYSHVKEKE